MITCTNCKEIYHQNATHCPDCGTEAPRTKTVLTGIRSVTETALYDTAISESEILGLGHSFAYAPFGERALACLIDGVIITVCSAILGGILGGFGTFVSFVITACYYGYFESSNYMGTPGKIIMKLKVLSVTGQRISFLNGVGRYAAKMISAVILGIGYLFPLFTSKKQALHDIIASCIVVKG